ncbi:ABC transporter permease [Aquidulcibacter sp.]|uniref:ABC transporter permease n=1 Tax=Aquidulcibacter sp. TaxID=2052990 RepID=UPI0025B8F46C|nr:ABC transporter permease [Aquidulcibacter sp.]MCA3692973.1 ABC transporter permease [Aquidulcibacter sp.]
MSKLNASLEMGFKLSFRTNTSKFMDGFAHTSLWIYLGNQYIESRFRRSALGPLWFVINALAFSVIAGMIWSAIFGTDVREFIPMIGIGFAIWGFIMACFIEGSGILATSGNFIKQMSISHSTLILRVVYAQIVYLVIGCAVGYIASVVLGRPTSIGSLLFLPGFFLVALAGFFTATVMSYFGARYRDLSHGLGAALQVLFVATPIIYPAEILIKKGYGLAVYLNPFHAWIEVIRVPLMKGVLADPVNYVSLVIYCVVAGLIAWLQIGRWSSKVVFWV